MANYPIFPSLSRAPSFESTRKIEDGTLKDPMESGYVATRPRFTRLRRTFGVSYKFLTAEDVRALDKFETQTVQGGAGAFYLPNLLPNGSFEFPSQSGGGVDSWGPGDEGGFATISPSSQADDGSVAIQFRTIPYTIANDANIRAYLNCNTEFPVVAGEVYQTFARVNAAWSMGSAMGGNMVLVATILYPDGTQNILNEVWVGSGVGIESTSGYVDASTTFSIPASTSGDTTGEMSIALFMELDNGTGAPVTLADGALIYLVDSVGLAQISSPQPNGRMPGLSPLVSVVRFTKGLQIRDAGIANGQKTYNVTFEVTEV